MFVRPGIFALISVVASTTFQPFADPGGIARHDARRYAHHGAVVGDVCHHYGISADDYIVTDSDTAQYFCPGRQHHVVADPRRIRLPTQMADGDALEHDAVLADCSFADE